MLPHKSILLDAVSGLRTVRIRMTYDSLFDDIGGKIRHLINYVELFDKRSKEPYFVYEKRTRLPIHSLVCVLKSKDIRCPRP